MKISELSNELNVSEMTIHRDIKPLIDEGFVMKTFGGVTLANNEKSEHHHSTQCIICSREINERLAYRLILANNKIEVACCAHCGLLRQRQLGESVIQAICPDFLKQTTISASLAWFVMDTSIHMGCCHPQVLTFEWKEHADKFVKGFGGEVFSFNKAIEINFLKWNEHSPCHKEHH